MRAAGGEGGVARDCSASSGAPRASRGGPRRAHVCGRAVAGLDRVFVYPLFPPPFPEWYRGTLPRVGSYGAGAQVSCPQGLGAAVHRPQPLLWGGPHAGSAALAAVHGCGARRGRRPHLPWGSPRGAGGLGLGGTRGLEGQEEAGGQGSAHREDEGQRDPVRRSAVLHGPVPGQEGSVQAVPQAERRPSAARHQRVRAAGRGPRGSRAPCREEGAGYAVRGSRPPGSVLGGYPAPFQEAGGGRRARFGGWREPEPTAAVAGAGADPGPHEPWGTAALCVLLGGGQSGDEPEEQVWGRLFTAAVLRISVIFPMLVSNYAPEQQL